MRFSINKKFCACKFYVLIPTYKHETRLVLQKGQGAAAYLHLKRLPLKIGFLKNDIINDL